MTETEVSTSPTDKWKQYGKNFGIPNLENTVILGHYSLNCERQEQLLINQTTQLNILEELNLWQQCCESLKSHKKETQRDKF